MSNEYGLRKRSHRKWVAGLTLMLSLMLVLSGCGVGKDGKGGSNGEGGKITLKMMHLWYRGKLGTAEQACDPDYRSIPKGSSECRHSAGSAGK